MCLTPRTFVDNLDRTESFAPHDVDYDSCDYIDVGESLSISSSDLAIMQLNIRGLYSKISHVFHSNFNMRNESPIIEIFQKKPALFQPYF